MVAGAADKIVQARALAPQNQNAIAGEIEAVVVRLAALIQPDDPQILPLELFKRAHKVYHARDAQVLSCAGAGLDSYGTERR